MEGDVSWMRAEEVEAAGAGEREETGVGENRVSLLVQERARKQMWVKYGPGLQRLAA